MFALCVLTGGLTLPYLLGQQLMIACLLSIDLIQAKKLCNFQWTFFYRRRQRGWSSLWGSRSWRDYWRGIWCTSKVRRECHRTLYWRNTEDGRSNREEYLPAKLRGAHRTARILQVLWAEKTADIWRRHHSSPHETSPEIPYWWRVTTQIRVVIGWCKFPTWHDQSEALPRYGYWRVISMEFLHSFLRRHFAEKPSLKASDRFSTKFFATFYSIIFQLIGF